MQKPEARSNNIFMRVIHAQATRILRDDYQRRERSSAKEINTADEFTSTIITVYLVILPQFP
jgi:hypothetical protein